MRANHFGYERAIPAIVQVNTCSLPPQNVAMRYRLPIASRIQSP
jgi:hypothetical protein